MKNSSVMQTMQRFFKFFTRKILTVELVGYSLQIPLRNQIQRAGVSIPSNIAEGDERKSNKER
jgi:four helix bundle protein